MDFNFNTNSTPTSSFTHRGYTATFESTFSNMRNLQRHYGQWNPLVFLSKEGMTYTAFVIVAKEFMETFVRDPLEKGAKDQTPGVPFGENLIAEVSEQTIMDWLMGDTGQDTTETFNGFYGAILEMMGVNYNEVLNEFGDKNEKKANPKAA